MPGRRDAVDDDVDRTCAEKPVHGGRRWHACRTESTLPVGRRWPAGPSDAALQLAAARRAECAF
jgi:hypothetical protein